MLTKDEVVERLRKADRSVVAADTGLPDSYLYQLVKGIIKNPGVIQIDTLRSYFESRAQ